MSDTKMRLDELRELIPGWYLEAFQKRSHEMARGVVKGIQEANLGCFIDVDWSGPRPDWLKYWECPEILERSDMIRVSPDRIVVIVDGEWFGQFSKDPLPH